MFMNKFIFNYCIPRQYTGSDGKDNFSIVKGGEKMELGGLSEIQKLADDTKPKMANPWLQVFNNGYRNTNSNMDWSAWNGFTFSDIDSKHYYKLKKQFDPMKVLNAIKEVAPYVYQYNYYCVYITGSGLGFRILWYWNCDRTKDNFLKCSLLTEQYTRDLFYRFGQQGKDIIDFEQNGHRVLDKCSKSVLQGMYISGAKIFYSEFIGCNGYGSCVIDDIDISDLYKTNNITSWSGDGKHSDYVKFVDKVNIDTNKIKYYPHQLRRCIYESLIVLFKDKDKVDEEWKYIAKLIPETDGVGGGHSHKFYEEEPGKNRWFELFNLNEKHSIHWLDDFGYKYSDNTQYVYISQFRHSWRNYCWRTVRDICYNIWLKDNIGLEYDIYDKQIETKIIKTGNLKSWNLYKDNFVKNTGNSIFSEYIDDIVNNISEDLKYLKYDEKITKLRDEYYKERWRKEEFKHLCLGYEIPADIVTYKMYADFYYRDENNIPIIKYNVLEDQIDVYGYWPETGKFQYHVFKYNDEYTHWKNNENFSNKAVKTDLVSAINKYVTRNHDYNPIKDYFNSLDLNKADEDVLETWAIKLFKAEDNKLTRTISKNFFIAAVKKIFVDDPTLFVFQHILFLKGKTGCGKTNFLTQMFNINGHSYTMQKVNPDDPDNIIGPLIAKNWCIQFGEEGKLKKADVNTQKEFVDRINLAMKYQKKYENEQTTIYPRVVCVKTTNDDDLFNDVSIAEGDRRNWLIVCNNEANSGSSPEMRRQIEEMKDIIWTTAYKLYLDNPNMDLELDDDLFKELGKMQEYYKLVKNDDIKEIYDDIFGRNYLTNDKGFIQNEELFNLMLKTDDTVLANIADDPKYMASCSYKQIRGITKIPGTWLINYIRKKYDRRYWTLLRKYMVEHGWEYKSCRYNKIVKKCWDGDLATLFNQN